MKNKQRKGFTIVELVIVIAVIAILAAVLIPTFSSIIKKANQSAYLQEKTNQQIADLAEKVDNMDLVTWDDVEKDVVKAVADAVDGFEASENYYTTNEYYTETPSGDLSETKIKEIVVAAVNSAAGSQLTEDQVKKIVENAVKNIKVSESSTTNNTTQIIEQYYDNGLDVIVQMNYAVYNAVHYDGAVVNTCYDALKESSKLGLGSTETGLVLQDVSVGFDLDTKKFVAVDTDKTAYENGFISEDNAAANAKKQAKIVVLETVNGDSNNVADLSANIYGTYLLYSSEVKTITTNKSFDAGESTKVTSVTYSNSGDAQSVVVRTNNGTLTVVAQNDHVEHYGVLAVANVQKVSSSTYVEHGTIGKMTIGADAKNVAFASTAVVVEVENQNTSLILDTTKASYVGKVDGTPTSYNVIKVYNFEQLQGLAKYTAADKNNSFINGKTISIEADIDCTGQEWIPFGNDYDNSYWGTIEGNGHKIIGFTNKYTDAGNLASYKPGSSNQSGSIFAFIAFACGEDGTKLTIRNLNFTDVDIDMENGKCVAALIGLVGNTGVSESTLKEGGSDYKGAKNTTVSIENVVVSGKIYATDKVGGFIGAADQAGSNYTCDGGTVTFKKCTNNAEIKANKNRGAAFIGQFGDGHNNSQMLTFDDCHNTGNITTDSSTYKSAFVSHLNKSASKTCADVINVESNCSNSGKVNEEENPSLYN